MSDATRARGDAVTRPGRPPGPLSPEYQEVLARYTAGTPPVEIARQLGRSRAWVGSAVQELRRRGALGPAERAPRPPPATVRRHVTLTLEDAAAIDASGEGTSEYIRAAIAMRTGRQCTAGWAIPLAGRED